MKAASFRSSKERNPFYEPEILKPKYCLRKTIHFQTVDEEKKDKSKSTDSEKVISNFINLKKKDEIRNTLVSLELYNRFIYLQKQYMMRPSILLLEETF